MSVYNYIIISGVASAALVALGHWRYLAWLAGILICYMASVIYSRSFGIMPEFFAGLCDCILVGLIAYRARYIWELWIGAIFVTSAFVNWAFLAHNVAGATLISADIHASILEILTLSAVMTIGGVAAFDKAGLVNGMAFRPWLRIFGRMRPVYQRRGPSA